MARLIADCEKIHVQINTSCLRPWWEKLPKLSLTWQVSVGQQIYPVFHRKLLAGNFRPRKWGFPWTSFFTWTHIWGHRRPCRWPKSDYGSEDSWWFEQVILTGNIYSFLKVFIPFYFPGGWQHPPFSYRWTNPLIGQRNLWTVTPCAFE